MPATKCFRRRNPSIEIQQETKALLEATLFKKLPKSLADTEGVMLTQKNTFFHVQPMRDCFVQTCCPSEADDQDCCFMSPDQCVKLEDHAPLRGRKGTEANIIVMQRKGSVLGNASVRCQSCPPTAPSTPSCRSDIIVSSITPPPPGIVRATQPPTLYTFAPNTTSYSTPQPLPLMTLLSQSTAPTDKVEKTTVMLRNVPYHEGQVGVLRLLESRGFLGKFDFFYAPLDFNSGNNLGYAFINFRSNEAVQEFFSSADGLRVNQEGWQQKELRVCWARVQGLNSNVEQYRNSPVNEMPVQFRPMLFDGEGGQVSFPRPDGQRPFFNSGQKSPPRRQPTRRPSYPPSNTRKPTRVP